MANKKGNGFNSDVIVAEAVAQCGCPEEKFRACAQKFGQPAETFAGWVAIKTPEGIRQKMTSLGVRCSGGSNRHLVSPPIVRSYSEERFA